MRPELSGSQTDLTLSREAPARNPHHPAPSTFDRQRRCRTFNVALVHGRQALVMAIFARLDVLGFQRLEYELTADAIDPGLDAALPAVLELESQIGEFWSGREG